ncbi:MULTISPECIES: hypothetical protein [Halorussus]|uniref:DUF7344 domain-containing protein n=1 Tax=Halorussus TaxID=1070314 RepID=UPI000E2139CB|nr:MULTISPECIES: hypothetical protein [Halorussus]NHN61153.1 hypothetical protein [Halorussus sp. JP-T4]
MSVGGKQTRSPEETEADEPTRDEIFEIVSNQRRRHVVHYLRQQDRPVELRELSTHLAAWENEDPPAAITHDQRRRVYTALRQSHLPKMDEVGVVDFDADRGVVRPSEGMADVELYLDVVPESEIPRSEYYLGLGAVCAALLTVAYVDIVPFDMLPDMAWAGLCVAALVASGAVDTYYDRKRRLGGEGSPPDVPDIEEPARDR